MGRKDTASSEGDTNNERSRTGWDRGRSRSKAEILDFLRDAAVIAIFRVDASGREHCLDAMDALLDGGIRAFEVTTTTPGAFELISRARERYRSNEAVVGIGTVLDAQTALQGIDAGAQFVISPSLEEEVVETCVDARVVCCPGTFTPTEIVRAYKRGADLIKVFPVSPVGPGYIKAVLAPLPWVRLVPTGGVDASNAAQYVRAGAYCLGVGGSLLPRDVVARGEMQKITSEARKIMDAVAEARVGH